MDKKLQKGLEAAGFRVGDAGDFLGLTDDERRLVELRLAVSRAVRKARENACLTQQQLAAKIKSSQSRIAKIEAGAPEVTLDLAIRALFAAGGELAEVAGLTPARGRRARKGQRSGRRAKVMHS
jgi:DNA-binding XRE family transcriptional regulator